MSKEKSISSKLNSCSFRNLPLFNGSFFSLSVVLFVEYFSFSGSVIGKFRIGGSPCSLIDLRKKEPLNKGRLRKEQEFNFEEMCPNLYDFFALSRDKQIDLNGRRQDCVEFFLCFKEGRMVFVVLKH
jgi:hypothetical protein